MSLVFIEVVASIITILCVVQAQLGRVETWPLGIIGAILFGYLFFESKLYADSALQLLYVGMGIIGWLTWSKNSDDVEFKVKPIKAFTLVQSLLIGAIVTVLIYALLKKFTDSEHIWLDSGITSLSLIANYFLIKRYLETWIMWAIVDVALIILMYSSGLYFSMVLYSMLLTICVYSYFDWRKILKDGE